MRTRSASAFDLAWPPVALAVIAIAVWQSVIVLGDVPPFLMPAPSAILGDLVAHPGLIWSATLVTGMNGLVGLVVGSVLAIVLAAVAAALRFFDQMSAPIVAAVAVVPIVSLAPVFYTMFGAASQQPRQYIAAVAAFAPVFLTTLRGLRQARPVHRDLMTAYAASGWQTTRAVTLPGALPYLFSGLNVASSLAVISALVTEYFGGPRDGLGSLITSAAATSNYATAWAYVFGAIVLGLVFYLVTLVLEWLVSRRA